MLPSTQPRIRDIIKGNRKEVTAVREVAMEEERPWEMMGEFDDRVGWCIDIDCEIEAEEEHEWEITLEDFKELRIV